MEKAICASLIFGILFQSSSSGENYPPLNAYPVDPRTITVSGISSGGAMVTQFHFSFSSQIIGTGVFEAGGYPCLSVPDQSKNCQKTPEKTNITRLNEVARDLANKGLIDPLKNMVGTKVYVFHGKNDSTVPYLSGQNVVDQYTQLGALVKAELSLNAGHGQPVDGNGYGGPCASANPDHYYMNECGYNGAYEMLNFFFEGQLIRPPKKFKADGRLDNFNQLEFSQYDPLLVSMDKMGYVYVPKNCQSGNVACKLHIAFHGCAANYAKAGYRYALWSQYADVAELNDIVILFPQSAITLLNPKGCWDVVGYSGKPDYATKIGKQVTAVYQMMNRVLGL